MDPHWSQRCLWSFDLETTGLDPRRDRIISAALMYVDPAGAAVIPSYTCIIDPGVPVPAEASAVNGLTTERVRAEGIRPAAALDYICGLLIRCRHEGGPLCIMNAPFDWPFLVAECARHGLAAPPIVPIFDPLVVDRHVDPYRKGGRRLADLCAWYGVTLDQAHEAGADAIAAAQVARALVARNGELLGPTPHDLHTEQIGWYRTWRDGLNAYWVRSGSTRRVTGSWPNGDLHTQSEDPEAQRVG